MFEYSLILFAFIDKTLPILGLKKCLILVAFESFYCRNNENKFYMFDYY